APFGESHKVLHRIGNHLGEQAATEIPLARRKMSIDAWVRHCRKHPSNASVPCRAPSPDVLPGAAGDLRQVIIQDTAAVPTVSLPRDKPSHSSIRGPPAPVLLEYALHVGRGGSFQQANILVAMAVAFRDLCCGPVAAAAPGGRQAGRLAP